MKMKFQQGAVLIITLWTVMLLTILVTAIAAQVQLSAKVVFNYQQELNSWANVQAAINQAEMELMLERMPRPAETIDDLSEIGRNPLYRYNGQLLELSYPTAENIKVRIYDHAGKINLRFLSRPKMRAMLEYMLGNQAGSKIEDMLDAWSDWTDLNDGVFGDGAESDYYQSLDTPYYPRNGRLESVEELLHIRGFNEVFAEIDLNAVFTLYTEGEFINLNLASKEAMALLPGLEEELINEIVLARQEADFIGNGDLALALIIPAGKMAKLRPWLDNSFTSNFYTIMAYQTLIEGSSDETLMVDIDESAYSEIVSVNSFSEKPVVLMLNTYMKIPARD